MQSKGAWDVITDTAFYKPLGSNALPPGVRFVASVPLRMDTHIPSACQDMRSLSKLNRNTYRMLMSMFNIAAHATGQKSQITSPADIRIFVEARVSDERSSGRRNVVGYTYHFVEIDPQAAMNAQADSPETEPLQEPLDPALAAIERQEQADLVAGIEELQLEERARQDAIDGIVADDENADSDAMVVAPSDGEVVADVEGTSRAPTTREVYADNFPLTDAIKRSVQEGRLVRGPWLAVASDKAKKSLAKEKNRRNATSPSSTVGVLLDASNTYHIESVQNFPELINPFLRHDRARLDASLVDIAFLESLDSDAPKPDAHALEAKYAHMPKALQEYAYYSVTTRHVGEGTSAAPLNSLSSTVNPWHYFSPLNGLFQNAIGVCKEQRDVRSYFTISPQQDQLINQIDALPRRTRRVMYDMAGVCDSQFTHFPFPNLVWEIPREAFVPELYIEAGWPLAMASIVPEKCLHTDSCNHPYAALRRVPTNQLNHYTTRSERLLLTNGEISTDDIFARLTEDSMAHLKKRHAGLLELLRINLRSPPSTTKYPITEREMREDLETRKERYCEDRHGNSQAIVSAALHREWTKKNDNRHLSVQNAMTGGELNKEKLRHDLESALEAIGGGAASIALGALPGSNIVATQNDLPDDLREDMEEQASFINPEAEMRKVCVFRRMRVEHLELHENLREAHVSGLQLLNTRRRTKGLGSIPLEDYAPFRLELLQLCAQLQRRVWEEFLQNKDKSAGIKAFVAWYLDQKPEDRVFAIADVNLAMRPQAIFQTFLHRYASDIANVSHLYREFMLVILARSDALVYIEEAEESLCNVTTTGDHAVGKSYIYDLMKSASVPGTVLDLSHMTEQVFNVQGNLDDLVMVRQEAPKQMMVPNKMGDNSDVINRAKERMTSRRTMTMAYTSNDNGTGRSYSISFAPCSCVFMMGSNDDLRNQGEKAIVSRMSMVSVPRYRKIAYGSGVASRQQHREVSRKDQVDAVSHEMQLLHFRVAYFEKAIQAGVYGPVAVTTYASDLLLDEIYDTLYKRERIDKPDNRAMKRIRHLSRNLHVLYMNWLVNMTPLYLHAYPTKESVQFSISESGHVKCNPDDERYCTEYEKEIEKLGDGILHYADDEVAFSQAEVDCIINQGFVPQWTPDVDSYLLTQFCGVNKDSAIQAAYVSQHEVMSVDTDHVTAFLAHRAGFGVTPVHEYQFRYARTQSYVRDEKTSKMNATPNHVMDANYLQIVLDDEKAFYTSLATSFAEIIPSTDQTKTALLRLQNTTFAYRTLEYDRVAKILKYANSDEGKTTKISPLIHVSPRKSDTKQAMYYISISFLMSHYGLDLDQLNAAKCDEKAIFDPSYSVGNPVAPNSQTVEPRQQVYKRGLWSSPDRRRVTLIQTPKDAQDYVVARYDHPLTRAIAATLEGPFLERGPTLGEEQEAELYDCYANPITEAPVFDYFITNPAPSYKDWALAGHIPELRRKLTLAGQVVHEDDDESQKQAILDMKAHPGILRLRRLKPHEGGHTISRSVHTTMHETTAMLNPALSKKRSAANAFSSRVQEASHFTVIGQDIDYLANARAMQLHGGNPLPVNPKYRGLFDRSLMAGFPPHLMAHLRIICAIEAKRGKKRLVYRTSPACDVIANIEARRMDVMKRGNPTRATRADKTLLGRTVVAPPRSHMQLSPSFVALISADHATFDDTRQHALTAQITNLQGKLPEILDVNEREALELQISGARRKRSRLEDIHTLRREARDNYMILAGTPASDAMDIDDGGDAGDDAQKYLDHSPILSDITKVKGTQTFLKEVSAVTRLHDIDPDQDTMEIDSMPATLGASTRQGAMVPFAGPSDRPESYGV